MKKAVHINILILVLTFFMAGLGSYAQNTKLSATQVLDKVVNKIQGVPSLNVTMNLNSANQSESATFTIAKEKFSAKIGGMEIFYDGKTQWTVNHEDKEISLTEPTLSELAETNPLAFMQNYKNKYNAVLVSSTSSSYTIGMQAKDKSAYVRSATIIVNSDSWLPTAMTAQLANGQTLDIHIVSTNIGKGLPISNFRANTKVLSGYEIIDLR